MTKQIKVGGVLIGGGAPVTIQSMTNTPTQDVAATVAQIQKLAAAGCEIVRVTVPTAEAALAVKAIKKEISIPLVADIHFDYRMAIAAMENGADKIRINPGNIGGADRLKAVVDEAKARQIPIRVGVNSGSLEKELVEKHGGRLGFTTGQVFSSTKLINTAMSGLSDEVRQFMLDFKTRHTMKEIRDYAEVISRLKVLVVGDVIIDKYTYCHVQGMMTKDMGYSSRLSCSEEYLGGAVAIARHLSSFTDDVTLMSVIGNEEGMRLRLFDELSDRIQLRLTCSSTVPTIVKHRYLTRNDKREEYRKVFAINNIPENVRYEDETYREFREKLESRLAEYDVVFVCDFGHGLINRDIIKVIQEKARFLALNCQTNSSNKGLNIITKYTRADVFSLDQQELKLAFPEDSADEKVSLKKLSDHLGGDGWLTRGSRGAWGIEKDRIWDCPAFTLQVKDTIGAGDAFFAVAGIFAAAGAPAEVGTVMGNIGGALGANIVGNKEAVEKVNVLKFGSTLMNV